MRGELIVDIDFRRPGELAVARQEYTDPLGDANPHQARLIFTTLAA